MEYIVTSLIGQTNYSLMNMVNMYNFYISVFEDLNDDQKKTYIDKMKFQVGMSFCDGLKSYVFRKNSKHEIIDYLNN